MKKAEIKLTIELDDNNVPESYYVGINRRTK